MTFDDDREDCFLLSLTLRPVLAADSGEVSVSYGTSELGLAWVSVSHCLKRWLWQLVLMLEWKLPPQSL
jgi:hypothetical protein